jgi:O-antigen ligase
MNRLFGWMKSPHKIQQILDKIAWISFLAFLAFLPVTSFPYFPPAIGGDALVRPLSIYPLFLLGILVVIPRLLKGNLPRHYLALGFFILVAICSGLISIFQNINPALNITSQERVLRALVTLGLGCAIYFAVSLTPRTREEINTALRALYLGFSAALVWGTLQLVYVVHFNKAYFKWLNNLQGLVSIRKLMNNRVSGMTYEPNWFGEQLTVLLLPWLLAAVLSGTSVFRWRWRWLTIELVLLAWSVVLLLFTFSRAGLLNLGVMVVLSILLYRLQRRKKGGLRLRSLKSTSWKRIALLVFEVAFVLAILLGFIFIASSKNEFFTRMWNYWQRPNSTLRGYLIYIGFEARMIYSETAFNTYASSPFLGVGPGNYALLFADMLPNRPLARTPEVLRLVTPEEGRDRLVTAKNFGLRLLAETGILGTAAFLAFLIAILGSVFFLWLSPHPDENFWGIGGILAMAAFLLSTLSFDSFAVPNMWVIFGFITAASVLARYPHPVKDKLSSEKLLV